MMWHKRATERPILGALIWLAIVVLLCLLHACGTEPTKAIQTAGNSFFPLAVGNRWVFQWDGGDGGQKRADTVLIDNVAANGEDAYYHLRCSWPGFEQGRWIRRMSNGNLTWATHPRGPERQFLLFDVAVGTKWPTGLFECADSLSMYEDYAVVTTPYGRFDGVREIGDVGQCMDAGWGIKLARGVGPVAVSWITIAGPRQCLLVDAQVRDDAPTASRAGPKRIVDGK